MSQLYNRSTFPPTATPVVVYDGIKDDSTRPAVYETIQVPIHYPHFMTYAEKGSVIARGGYANEHEAHYGSQMFNELSPYATMITPFINLMVKYNNPFVVQRIIPEDATKEARLCLALEVIKTDKLRRIARREDGYREIDANAREVSDGTLVSGHVARWRVIHIGESALGEQEVKVGNGTFQYEHDPAASSKIYPIMEVKAAWIGKYANNIGIRLWAGTTLGRDNAIDEPTVYKNNAMLYRIAIVQRENYRSRPRVIKTLMGEDHVEFTFKPETYDMLDDALNFDDKFINAYQNTDTTRGQLEVFSPIGDAYVYQENIDTLLSEFFYAEKLLNKDFDGIEVEEGKHLFNFVTGNDLRGRAYHSFHLLNELGGADISMGETSTHYLEGGKDGTMNNVNYDRDVRYQYENFGNLENKYHDMALHPCRQFYDPGFSAETKNAMFKVIDLRPDTNITLSTCDFVKGNRKKPSAQEASSRGFSLVMSARRHPESVIHGTPVTRVCVIPEAMQLLNSRYKGYVPMSYEVARMRAQYMNRPSGMRPGYGYDANPYNFVQEGKDVTNMSQPYSTYVKNWENGMSYWAYVNPTRVFSPIVRTVYGDDSSVLTSDILMQALCDLTFQSYTVWTTLSGNNKLDNESFLNQSNETLRKLITGRYDSRFEIVPNSFFTDNDKQRGYSWTLEVDVYANNARTVLRMTPIVHRKEN